ncbi:MULTISPECIES: hypothetical protein [Ralstonia]|jgi:ElaB/YqjD/DUF883 family membrane-anchored ribosome-binding protein|uniref:DUF883 domain-containing protein n=1 Tax=Ralstonia edaphi TaxID=3058599 RepID=A0AB72X3Y7_9RALS|nr:hypothetical protein [Ralstonia sp. LMG 6871]CAJ0702632.1 hypothetical protein LMG19089_03142 [Ralstonia sp. LMG 6871]CAJ0743024.1 hypothetical protein R16034_03439 [Ralstonia sp. LMG 6871]
MTELSPKPPTTSNGTNGTNGANGATVTTLHPQIDHTAQRVKDATAEGIDRLASVLSTALTQFDKRTEQLKNLHANVSEQASGSVRQHPVITIGLAFVAGMLLEQLTRD